jgi:hypothetical protein
MKKKILYITSLEETEKNTVYPENPMEFIDVHLIHCSGKYDNTLPKYCVLELLYHYFFKDDTIKTKYVPIERYERRLKEIDD